MSRMSCIGVVAALLACVEVYAVGVPAMLNHQGVVKVGGTPFTGMGNFRFAIVYKDGGGDSNMWTNDGSQLGTSNMPDTAVALSVENGLYSALLGDGDAGMAAIDVLVFGDTPSLHLRIWFDDGVHGPQMLEPDQPLSSSAYAGHADSADSAANAGDADTLEGNAASAFAEAGHTHNLSALGGVLTDVQVPNDITVDHAGSADSATTADSAGDADTLDGTDSTGFAAAAHDHDLSSLSGAVTDGQVPDDITVNAAGDADTLDGLDSTDFMGTGEDYGRSGIASNLYEGSSTLTSKYINASGPDSMTGSATSTNAVFGVTNSAAGRGIYGETSGGQGVYGYDTSTSHQGYLGGSFAAVYGRESDSTYGYIGSYSVGVYGRYQGTGNFGSLGSQVQGAYGVRVESGLLVARGKLGTEEDSIDCGVWGNSSQGRGVSGSSIYGSGTYGSTDIGYGIHGRSNPGGLAAYFDGPTTAKGTLTCTSALMKIDHPLDPQGQYLYHASVESSEMLNVYSGTVTLGENGAAWVTLPEWVSGLNRDFRYQLTCIGGYAPVYIAKEVAEDRFQIAGGSAGLKVSWQLTGVRQDAFATQNAFSVEEKKPGMEQGSYLHPEAFGEPRAKSVEWARDPVGEAAAEKELDRLKNGIVPEHDLPPSFERE